jgi:hypothetical protein
MPDFEKRAASAYLEAHKAFSAVLLRHDPMLIGEGVPDDEYDQEATRLLTKFKDVASSDDVEAIVRDFFADPDIERFLTESWKPLAAELWQTWSTFKRELGEARVDDSP